MSCTSRLEGEADVSVAGDVGNQRPPGVLRDAAPLAPSFLSRLNPFAGQRFDCQPPLRSMTIRLRTRFSLGNLSIFREVSMESRNALIGVGPWLA